MRITRFGCGPGVVDIEKLGDTTSVSKITKAGKEELEKRT